MSTKLNQQALRVATHYEKNVIDYEKIRLEQDSPVEFELTTRTMNKWIKNDSIVLDVGVGVGHYASLLAQRGCKLHLVDICERFLNLSLERLAQNHLSENVLSSTLASATDLDSNLQVRHPSRKRRAQDDARSRFQQHPYKNPD